MSDGSRPEPSLLVKSYFADSVEETLDQARAELGPDALLLNQREAPPEARHLGAFEVVFGVRRTPPQSSPPDAAPFEELRRSVDELRGMLNRQQIALATSMRVGSGIAAHLSGYGVALDLAAEIEAVVLERMRSRGVAQVGLPPEKSEALAIASETLAELERRFEVSPTIGRCCALVGPTGAGKTTTLMKLAIMQGLAVGRQVRLISIDDRRIGAAAEFQTYASILGVSCDFPASLAALADCINAAPTGALILIDTPGQTRTMDGPGQQLADFLRERQDIDTHLILTASSSDTHLRQTVDRFTAFQPAKLLFTRVDESDSTGAMISESARSKKPISFLATGPAVPEDLEAATKRRVLRPMADELPRCWHSDS